MRHIHEETAYGPEPDRGNFWRGTVAAAPPPAALVGDADCEVAIIGAGVTGLNAALALASAGRDVRVLDTHYPGWGASGRNGGFCCLGGAKAGAATLTRRFGETAARAYLMAERAAVDHVRALLDGHGIAADTHSRGETLIAHRPGAAAALRAHAEEIRTVHGLDCDVIGPGEMAAHGMAGPGFHGAVTTPVGMALNPLKYVTGLAAAAADAGARLHGSSPVTAIAPGDGGGHLLHLPRGRLRARTLIIATNGYSSETVPPWLAGRYLPAQSSVLVTRPLREAELNAQGWTTRQMCFDTRNLLHYFRLMPDNRMLFGMRGGWRATPRALRRAAAATRRDFDRLFPAWRGIEAEHAWSGFVCLSRDLTPFAGPVPGLDNAYAALAYHGNGVAMGSYAGRLIAGQILDDPQGRATPEVMRRPLRRFELGRLRRLSLPLAYAWFGLRDRA